jgi:hypothetical protein
MKKNTLGENETVHPSYGVISLSRHTCHPPQPLVGSHVKHGNYISLTIKEAKYCKDGMRERFSAVGCRRIAEVCISGVQLGELLTSMNVGEGVPCTISYAVGDGEYRRPEPPYESPVAVAHDDMKEKLGSVHAKAKNLAKRAGEILGKPKSKVSSEELKELQGIIYNLNQEMESNIPYYAKCVDEKMETVVSHAKGEIEAFAISTIQKAGLDALGIKPVVMLE